MRQDGVDIQVVVDEGVLSHVALLNVALNSVDELLSDLINGLLAALDPRMALSIELGA